MCTSPVQALRLGTSRLLFALTVGIISVANLTFAGPVPSNYIVYSIEDIKIGDRAGTSSSGLIGSQGDINVGYDAIVQGSIYANGKIRLYDRARVTESVVAGDSVIRGYDVIAGSITQYATVEQYTLPTKSVSIGTNDTTVTYDDSIMLEPGNYNNVTVMDRGKLTLRNGVYNINSLTLNYDARLILDYPANGAVEINSKSKLVVRDRVKMLFVNDSNSYAIKFYLNGTDTCIIGYDGEIYGNFTAPNAMLILHDRTKFTGCLYAKKLELQPSIYCVLDTIFPSIELITPLPGSVIENPRLRIALYFNDNRSGLDWSTLQINLNGSDVTTFFTVANDSAIWQVPSSYTLPEGANIITADIFDRAGNGTQITRTFTVETPVPVVIIESPQDGYITNQQTIPVVWSIDGVNQTTRISESLQDGQNTIIRSYTNGVGRTGTDTLIVTLDRVAPVVVITLPANGTITNQSILSVSWTVDGISQSDQLTETLTEGLNTIVRSYTEWC